VVSKLSVWVSLLATSCVGGSAPADPFDLGVAAVAAGGGSAGAHATAHQCQADESVSGDPSELPAAGSKDSHFPLVDGASWTFHHENPSKAPWDEVDTMRATMYLGKTAFVFDDEEDAQGEQTSSTLVVDGSGVFRVYKEVHIGKQLAFSTRYDPAFLRYDEAWLEPCQSVTLDDGWQQTCVISSTAKKCAPGAMESGVTTHIYTLVNRHSQVTVPAGTFDAVEIERTNPGDPLDPGSMETKHFWFAVGVGKVREEDAMTGATEVLSAYELP
jgi:hypothetical protein